MVPSNSSVLILHQHIFWHARWDSNIKMSTKEKAEVSGQNQIPINKEKLKEEHKAEHKAITDAFEQQCLLSFSTNRSGEVIKKFNFPTLPPYDEAQKDDRMAHMVNQAVGQTFINHSSTMANSVHNAVLKTLQERGIVRFCGTGPSAG